MKKINIVIPTYNRPNYLKRILSYYSKDGEKYNIIVADSSSDENAEKNKEIISSFSSLDIINPKRYPYTMNMFYKLADALNFAEEEYCVICADDDFITPSGIDMSVKFLNKNSDYLCAHGTYIGFYLKDNEKGKTQFYWKPSYSYDSSTSSSSQERLLFHLSNYSVATFYAVHKTDFLNMLFKETVKYTDEENDGQFGELLSSMLTLIHGKMKRLDVLYCAREALLDSAGRTSKKFSNFVNEGTYDWKYSRFKECLAIHLNNNSQLGTKKAKKVVDKGWDEYTKHYRGFVTSKISYMMNNMPLSLNVNEGARRAYRKLFRRNGRKKCNYLGTCGSTNDPSEKYMDEFNKIKKCAMAHFKK